MILHGDELNLSFEAIEMFIHAVIRYYSNPLLHIVRIVSNKGDAGAAHAIKNNDMQK